MIDGVGVRQHPKGPVATVVEPSLKHQLADVADRLKEDLLQLHKDLKDVAVIQAEIDRLSSLYCAVTGHLGMDPDPDLRAATTPPPHKDPKVEYDLGGLKHEI